MSRSFPLAIATIVAGWNDTERQLENRTIANLAQLGFPVCIASIRPADRNTELEQGPARVIRMDPGPSIGEQLRAAILAASKEADRIFYLAGDKAGFSAYLVEKLPTMIRERVFAGCSLVNFGRTPKAFDTFPACQRLTETAINLAVEAMFGHAVDAAYGAYIYHRAIAETVIGTAGFAGLQPLGYLIGRTYQAGRSIVWAEDDFKCPESQRSEQDEISCRYRISQCAQFLEGFSAGLA